MRTVELDIHTNAAHLQQTFTGLTMLARQREIRLRYRFTRTAFEERRAPFAQSIIAGMHVDGVPVCFDMSDGASLSEEYLASTKFYFKRGYDHSWVNDDSISDSVRPYGLSYMVMPDEPSAFLTARALAFPRAPDWIKNVVRSLDAGNRLHFSPRLSHLETPKPTSRGEPRVMFLARAWDTESDAEFELSQALKDDRQQINEIRAACVRRLRAEFGERALVGMIDTEHARKHYPDCLIDSEVTQKQRYLTSVRKYPICITSTGLHGSIGWRFGEYVALARAIVSEPLNYVVPGDFSAMQNYLEFTSPDECVERVGQLIEDEAACLAMMQANHRYYERCLRPDRAVASCLAQVVV